MDKEQMEGAERRLVEIVNSFESSDIAVPSPQYVQAVSTLLLFGQLEKMEILLWRIHDEIEDMCEEEDDAEDVRDAKLILGGPHEGRVPFEVVQDEFSE